MDDLRLQAVAARVVAWHNRHPLARRIHVQQVRSVGYVALGAADPELVAPPAPEAQALAVIAALAARREPAAAAVPESTLAAAVPAEEDYTAAFAALAEHQAGEAGSVVIDDHGDPKVEVDALPEGSVEFPPPAPIAAPALQPAHIPTLRDRLLVRAQQPAVQGALLVDHGAYRPSSYSHAAAPGTAADAGDGDRFMAPLSPGALSRWVLRHGRELRQPPADGPIRRVATAAAGGGPVVGTTYVMTAAIAGGGLSSRVLVGAGSAGPVLGTRLWSVPRVATAAALLGLLLLAAAASAALALRPAAVVVAPGGEALGMAPAVAASAASAASAPFAAASAASAASAATAATAATAAAAVEAAAPAETAASAAAAETESAPPAAAPAAVAALPDEPLTTARPLPAAAKQGGAGLPLRGSPLSEEDKAAARAAVAAARAGRGAAAPAPATATVTAQPPAEDVRRAAGPAPGSPAFAISTRSLRTRAEGEQLQVAIAAVLGKAGSAARHVDLLPEGEDWRVVAWPFSGRADADRYRAVLAGRGMKVEVVGF